MDRDTANVMRIMEPAHLFIVNGVLRIGWCQWKEMTTHHDNWQRMFGAFFC
ncbi:hypothetical protein BDB00DRAFT_807186, partial [Zychaea mexicana]|uniref:uncharacterized protein n=1 Tax=Zychaea mexicana TaxID=64656 RepID=UPI0022FE08D7